jgi:hypothetical protein
VRAVSIEGQEGIKLHLATPWNQLPKGTKVTVKMPRKKFGAFLLDVLRLRAPRAKVGDAVTLVTPRDKLEEFLNLLPESVTLISCPEESAEIGQSVRAPTLGKRARTDAPDRITRVVIRPADRLWRTVNKTRCRKGFLSPSAADGQLVVKNSAHNRPWENVGSGTGYRARFPMHF